MIFRGSWSGLRKSSCSFWPHALSASFNTCVLQSGLKSQHYSNLNFRQITAFLVWATFFIHLWPGRWKKRYHQYSTGQAAFLLEFFLKERISDASVKLESNGFLYRVEICSIYPRIISDFSILGHIPAILAWIGKIWIRRQTRKSDFDRENDKKS